MLVSERARVGAQPLPDGYGEGQGLLPDYLSEVGATTPGLPLATHADPAKVNNKIPSEVEVEVEVEVEAVVLRLRPHRMGVHNHLRAEHFKQWQW